MPPLLSHHHEVLLLLLLAAVAASHGDSSGDTYDPSMCLPQNYTCGNVSISYPFYLSGHTNDLNGYSNPYYCGYPGLGIICDNGKPILPLGEENCTVTSIDGSSAYLSLADADVVDSSCPRVDHNVTLGPISWLHFPANTIGYLDFFLNCNFTPGPIQPPSIGWIMCEGFASDYPGQLSFVFWDDIVPHGDWRQQCDPVIQVPVLKHVRVGPNDTTWRSTGYGDVLRQGFQMSWDNNIPGPCSQCEESKGRCAFNQTGGFLGCLCNNGRINGTICGTDNSTAELNSRCFVTKPQ